MKNTMSKIEYALTQLWFSMLVMMYFRTTCFTFIFGLNKSMSCLIYWGVIIVVTLLGYAMTRKNKRNAFSVFVNSVFPSGIYAFITYADFFTPIYWIMFGIGGVLIVAFAGLVFYTKPRPNMSGYKLLKSKAKCFLHGARSIMAICMAILIFSIGTNSLFGNPMYKTTIQASAFTDDSEQWTVKNQIEIVRKLKPDIWNELSRNEKQTVLGVIGNIESNYLGLTHSVDLGFTVLEPNTLGAYRQNLEQIFINLEHLDKADPDDVLHTLLHEMYHVYQRRQVEVLKYIPEGQLNLLMFSKIIKYSTEFENYNDGDWDYDAYKDQSLEIMANCYADEGVRQYYELIDKYTNN